jgi:hypothetical protein
VKISKLFIFIGLMLLGMSAHLACRKASSPTISAPVTVYVDITSTPSHTPTPVYTGTPTGTPTITRTPVFTATPTSTPTITDTSTPTATPTVTQFSVYGNRDSSPSGAVTIPVYEAISIPVTITATTNLTGVNFYAQTSDLSSSPAITFEIGVYSKGVSMATLVFSCGWDSSAVPVMSGHWYNIEVSAMTHTPVTLTPGVYLLTGEYGATCDNVRPDSNALIIGTQGSTCLAYLTTSTYPFLSCGDAISSWNWRYGHTYAGEETSAGDPVSYSAALATTTCYEMYITTTP